MVNTPVSTIGAVFGSFCRTAGACLAFAVFLMAASTAPAQSLGAINDVVAGVRYTGRVHASERAFVSNTVNGHLTRIHFTPGDYVEQGQLLFELGPQVFVHKVEAGEAAVARRRIELDIARTNAERVTELGDRGAATTVDTQDAASRLALAEVALAEAEAQLSISRLELASTQIRAPISGLIGAPQYQLGAYLKTETGRPLAELTKIDPVLVSYDVPYNTLILLERLAPNGLQELFLRFEISVVMPSGIELPFVGTPRYSANELREGNSLTVWAEVPNPDTVLIPGLPVEISARLRK